MMVVYCDFLELMMIEAMAQPIPPMANTTIDGIPHLLNTKPAIRYKVVAISMIQPHTVPVRAFFL